MMRVLLAALLLAPLAGAQAVAVEFAPLDDLTAHRVADGVDALVRTPGNPVVGRLLVTDDAGPVHGARVQVDGRWLLTNDDGEAFHSLFEHGGAAHLQTVRVTAVEVPGDDGLVPVDGAWPELSVLWTHLTLRLSAPADAVAGQDVPVTVEAFWQRTGHPAAGVPVTVLHDGQALRVVTEADGQAHVRLPSADAGTHALAATVAPADRPNGVGPTAPALLEVPVLAAAQESTSSDADADGSDTDDVDASDPDAQADDAGAGDDPATEPTPAIVESGPRPAPEPADDLTRPIHPPTAPTPSEAAAEAPAPPTADTPGPGIPILTALLAAAVLRRNTA